ncbi:MAG: hypothetical protein ACRDMV_13215 [Streptosporangiales bacterium]
MSVRFSVGQGEQFKALSRSLREQGDGALQRRLRADIRKAGKPVVAKVKQRARNVHVSSSKGGHAPPDKSTRLRERVANATKLDIRPQGIRIKVIGRKVDPVYGRRLPKYLDALPFGKYKRWRHPVFGNWNVHPDSARQQRGFPYFGVTIRHHAQDFRRAVQRAMDDAARDITD